jgi:hypothetical protein
MSLRTDKDNIYFILPESRYSVSSKIDGYMEEDFTLHVTAKLFPETITNTESFLIARNGMHSGVSTFRDENDIVNIMFTYWFNDKNGNPKVKQVTYKVPESLLNGFNRYTMICDHNNEKKISCYVNDEIVGEMLYGDDIKQTYENGFYWFGCGSMIGPEEHRAFGVFEYRISFVSNKKLSLEELKDFTGSYKSKYSEIIFGDLRRLKNDCPHRETFAFVCDFEHYNRYKVWDLSFSGNYPQFYIEDNIYF